MPVPHDIIDCDVMPSDPDPPTTITTDGSNIQVEPLHPPEAVHTRSPPDGSLLAPQLPGDSSSVPLGLTLSNHALPDPGPDAGKSSLQPGAVKRGRNASIVSDATTTPEEYLSRLYSTQTSTAAAVTTSEKRILVDTLKGLGDIFSVTGDGTNDGPALKYADVDFSLGIAGTEIAKEASDIILMDDDLPSIVSAIIWGRCVNDSVRKFLQFQVSVNITAVLITFISAVASDEKESVLTAGQQLWINIFVNTFAALTLATDLASPELKRMPDRKTAPLFSADMGKMIIGQSIYQTFIVLLFQFADASFWGYHVEKEHAELKTMVFNTFMFSQIFNLVNCRSSTRDKNIFRGLSKNWYFIVITLIEVAIQILIVSFGGAAFQVAPMNGRDWVMSVALGFVSIPLGFLIRCIPNSPVERLLIALRIIRDLVAPPKLAESAESAEVEEELERVEGEGENSVINEGHDRLQAFSNIRGARGRTMPVVVSAGNGSAPQPGELENPTTPVRRARPRRSGVIQAIQT